jgi:hypothetical protein
MRRTLFLLALSVLTAVVAGPLMAQDNPFVGTWKLNVAKSKSEPKPVSKSQTRTVVAEGAGAKYTSEGVAADGTSYAFSFSTNYDGKDFPVTGTGMPGGADSIAIKRLSPNKVEAILKRSGKEIGKSTAEVSKDGKVTIVRGNGKNPDGVEYHTESVYDKQ